MPALPAVAKVVRCDLRYSLGVDSNVENRLFFSYAGALSQTDAQTFAGLVRAQWIAHPMVQLATTLTLFQTEVTDLTSSTAAQALDTTTGAGANANAAAPNGVAFIAKFKLARRYRGGHPKVYLPGATGNNIATGAVWNGTYANSVMTAFAAGIGAIAGGAPAGMGAITHVNVSYFLGFHNVTLPSGRTVSRPTLRVAPVVDAVISYAFNPNVASQRRRNETP